MRALLEQTLPLWGLCLQTGLSLRGIQGKAARGGQKEAEHPWEPALVALLCHPLAPGLLGSAQPLFSRDAFGDEFSHTSPSQEGREIRAGRGCLHIKAPSLSAAPGWVWGSFQPGCQGKGSGLSLQFGH